MFKFCFGFLLGVFLCLVGCIKNADAHDWYPPSCCGGNDCAPVSAWMEDGQWVFRYTDGKVYPVPSGVIQKDETNKEPFQAHACVVQYMDEYSGQQAAPYVRCFWRKAAGI